MKRYIIFPRDFDTRTYALKDIDPSWTDAVKNQYNTNQNNTIERIKNEFGEYNFDKKLANFKDIGHIPCSIITYHNFFYRQARNSFIHEFYYPALTSRWR